MTTTEAQTPGRKPWWRRWYSITGAAIIVLFVIVGIAGADDDEEPEVAAVTTTAPTTEATTSVPTPTTINPPYVPVGLPPTTARPTQAEEIRQAHDEAAVATGAVADAAQSVLVATCDMYRHEGFSDGSVELEEAIEEYCPEAEPLTPEDFTVELIILENKCFNSAGANIEAEPQLTSNTGRSEGVVLVTYDVTNIEHTETYTIEVDLATGEYSFSPLRLSTAACEDEPTATVTAVRER